MAANTPSMRNDVMWAIRDARGLSSNEKCFLWAVESRGVMFTTQERARQDMGLSRGTFYKTRNRLRERGLLRIHRRGPNATTQYRVNDTALQALVPMEAPTEEPEAAWWETPDATTETPHSPTSGNDIGAVDEVSTSDQASVSSAATEVEPEADTQEELKNDHLNGTKTITIEGLANDVEVSENSDGQEVSLEIEHSPGYRSPSSWAIRSLLSSISPEIRQKILSLVEHFTSVEWKQDPFLPFDHSNEIVEILDSFGYFQSPTWREHPWEQQVIELQSAWDELDTTVQGLVDRIFSDDQAMHAILVGWIVALSDSDVDHPQPR